jgi:hypothetical protein
MEMNLKDDNLSRRTQTKKGMWISFLSSQTNQSASAVHVTIASYTVYRISLSIFHPTFSVILPPCLTNIDIFDWIGWRVRLRLLKTSQYCCYTTEQRDLLLFAFSIITSTLIVHYACRVASRSQTSNHSIRAVAS